jgi:hypothetical protein
MNENDIMEISLSLIGNLFDIMNDIDAISQKLCPTHDLVLAKFVLEQVET